MTVISTPSSSTYSTSTANDRDLGFRAPTSSSLRPAHLQEADAAGAGQTRHVLGEFVDDLAWRPPPAAAASARARPPARRAAPVRRNRCSSVSDSRAYSFIWKSSFSTTARFCHSGALQRARGGGLGLAGVEALLHAAMVGLGQLLLPCRRPALAAAARRAASARGSRRGAKAADRAGAPAAAFPASAAPARRPGRSGGSRARGSSLATALRARQAIGVRRERRSARASPLWRRRICAPEIRRSASLSCVRSLFDPLFEDARGVFLIEVDEPLQLLPGAVVAPLAQALRGKRRGRRWS